MARPTKVELDYFPLDCRLNDRMKLVEAEFGLAGFAIIIKVFQKIYGGKGYYCEWNEEVVLLFAREINAGGNTVSEVIEGALRRGIFSKELYEKYGILTSERIQKTYFDAASRRDCIEIDDRYLLISHTLLPENVSINGVNVNKNPVNVGDNPQKKRKERKREEKKLNEIKREEKMPPASPSKEDVMEQCRKSGYIYVDPERFYDFCKGKRLKGWELMLGKWDEEDKESFLSKHPPMSPQEMIIMMQEKGFSQDDAVYAMMVARKRELKEERYGQQIP